MRVISFLAPLTPPSHHLVVITAQVRVNKYDKPADGDIKILAIDILM